VVEQIQELYSQGAIPAQQQLTFRCIGLRTDMKAKVFEWVDSALEVVPGLLADAVAADTVRLGLQHAEDWLRDLVGIGRQVYGDIPSRWEPLRRRLAAAYWRELTAPFRDFVMQPDAGAAPVAKNVWTGKVLALGEDLFDRSLDEMGDRGEDLRLAAQARFRCRLAAARRRDWLQ
jgi:CRISPR system Cascade subunit CasA